MIRFTQPSVFNDPFEMNPYIEAIATDQYIDNKFKKEHEAHVLKTYNNKPLSYRWKIPFSQFYLNFEKGDLAERIKNSAKGKVLYEARKTIPNNIDAAVGILSLTVKPDNLLMWAHYADSHKGMVLEFDGEHEFFNRRILDSKNSLGLDADLRSEYGFLRQVQYDENRPALTISEIKDFSQLLIKSKDWAYEEELRLLMPLPKAFRIDSRVDGKDVHLFTLPPSAITGVIFGAKAHKDLKAEVSQLISSRKDLEHIKFGEMALDEKAFKLLFKPTQKV
jgi:hypothetical protein